METRSFQPNSINATKFNGDFVSVLVYKISIFGSLTSGIRPGKILLFDLYIM